MRKKARRGRRLAGGEFVGVSRSQPFAQEVPDTVQRPARRFGPPKRMRAGRTGVGAGGGITREYLYKKSSLKRRSKSRPNTKLMVDWVIQRCQGIKQENPAVDYDAAAGAAGFPGYYVINRGTSVGTTGYLTPLYVVDLTTFANAGLGAFEAVQRLNLDETAKPVFIVQQVQASSGNNATTPTWQPEDSRNALAQSLTGCTYIQHMWYDIRLKLYGARKQSVTYDIMLLKFKKDQFPHDGNPPAGVLANERNSFWQNICRSSMVNTILPGDFDWTKHVTILKRKRVALGARDTSDADQTPPSIDFKWFVKDTRIRSFKENSGNWVADTQVDSVAWQIATTTAVSNNPKDRSRVFLFIRATDMTPVATGDDADDSGSFDMCIRRMTRLYR